jgi:hypothetical protein
VALSPFQPNWMFTPLYLTARGFTTGAMPVGLGSLEARLDVFDSLITVARSDGETRTVALLPVRTVAQIYAALSAAVTELHVSCVITTEPQEVPDTTPLHEDHRACEYDVAAVQRWFRAFTATAAVFERWRVHFFGRSGVQLWWGVLDMALILFNGKHVTAPTDRGYLMKYDLDAELMNVGLYLGDEKNAPFFYGYIYPEPPGAPGLPVRPAATSWSDTLHEWILPYDAVRTASDPEADIRAFLDSIYEQCISVGGWDRDALAYVAPKSRHRAG